MYVHPDTKYMYNARQYVRPHVHMCVCAYEAMHRWRQLRHPFWSTHPHIHAQIIHSHQSIIFTTLDTHIHAKIYEKKHPHTCTLKRSTHIQTYIHTYKHNTSEHIPVRVRNGPCPNAPKEFTCIRMPGLACVCKPDIDTLKNSASKFGNIWKNRYQQSVIYYMKK